MREHKERFTVDGVLYEFIATEGGDVMFYVVGGGTSKKLYSPHWWYDDPNVMSTSDLDIHKSSIPILRVVSDMVRGWVFTKKPYAFRFSSPTERKRRIYRWYSKRFARQIRRWYVHYEHNGTLWFVRKAY